MHVQLSERRRFCCIVVTEPCRRLPSMALRTATVQVLVLIPGEFSELPVSMRLPCVAHGPGCPTTPDWPVAAWPGQGQAGGTPVNIRRLCLMSGPTGWRASKSEAYSTELHAAVGVIEALDAELLVL